MGARSILFLDFCLFLQAICDEGSTILYYNIAVCEDSGENLSCPYGSKIKDINISTILHDLNQSSCTHSSETTINRAANCVGESSCNLNNKTIDFSKFNKRTMKLAIKYSCCGKDGNVSKMSKDICPGDLMRDINCTGMELIKINSVESVKSKCWTSKTQNDADCNFEEIVETACDNKQMCLPVDQPNITYRWNSCIEIPKLVNINYSCSAQHVETGFTRIKADTAHFGSTDPSIATDTGSTISHHNIELCEDSSAQLSCREGSKIEYVNISAIHRKYCTQSEETKIDSSARCVGKSSCILTNRTIDFSKFSSQTLKLKINYSCLDNSGNISEISADVCPSDIQRDIKCNGIDYIKISSVQILENRCVKQIEDKCDLTAIVSRICNYTQMCFDMKKINITVRLNRCTQIPKLVNIGYSCSGTTDSTRISTDKDSTVAEIATTKIDLDNTSSVLNSGETDSTGVTTNTDSSLTGMLTTTLQLDQTFSTISIYIGVSVGIAVCLSVAIASVCFFKIKRQEHFKATTDLNVQRVTKRTSFTELRILPIQLDGADETGRPTTSTKQSTTKLNNQNPSFLLDPKESGFNRKQVKVNTDNKADNTETPTVLSTNLINREQYTVLDPTVTGFNRTVQTVRTVDSNYNLDSKETNFDRTGINNVHKPAKTSYSSENNRSNDTPHISAESQHNLSTRNTDTNIYSHAVNDIYDESQDARRIALDPNYDHFFVQTPKQK